MSVLTCILRSVLIVAQKLQLNKFLCMIIKVFSDIIYYRYHVKLLKLFSNNMSLYFCIFLEPVIPRFCGRRKSVFAEAYDPENDADEDEGASAIFPKTDDQRSRLVESVKNILLFRSLDTEQV